MIRVVIIPLISITIFFTSASADTQEEQAAQYINSWIAQIRGTAPPAVASSEYPPAKCGTPAFMTLARYRLAKPNVLLDVQSERPVLPDSFGTEHFLIHYATSGDSAVYQSNIDSLAGIPRYVTRTADIFEHVWSVEIDSLGYRTPLADFGVGGDDRFDVYLVNLGPGYFGFTTEDSIVGMQASSHIELENDFAESGNYASHPIDAVKVTAAHEFFHAIQFAYDFSEFDAPNPSDPTTYKPWWEEASSTWMETVVYPSIKDYLGYLPAFYKNIWMGLGVFSLNARSAEGIHPYASCVWPIYLTKKFNDISIMRDIWQRCGQVAGYNTLPATDGALRARNSDIASSFLEFEIWNFNTGALADTVHYYTDGRLYPTAETTAFLSDLSLASPSPIPGDLEFPQQFATNYYVLNSPGKPGGIIANFNGQNLPSGLKWHVALLGFRENDSQWRDIQVDESSGDGAGDWPAWNTYRCVVVVSTVTGLNPNYSAFTYGGTLLYDPTLTGGQENASFGISKAFPSPYVISSADSLTIQYSLDKFYTYSDMEFAIYDASGGLVQELPGQTTWLTSPGEHKISWDGKNPNGDFLASGIYIILFKAGSNTATGKFAVVNGTK